MYRICSFFDFHFPTSLYQNTGGCINLMSCNQVCITLFFNVKGKKPKSFNMSVSFKSYIEITENSKCFVKILVCTIVKYMCVS